MPKLRNVLCAIDFSPASLAAFEQAKLFARRDRAVVHAIHAYSAPILPYADASVSAAWLLDERMRARSEESLGELVARRAGEDARTEAHLVSGIPAEAISREAERLRCDLIVLGTSERSRLPRFVLGSVAERVVRTSLVDVLTVPLGAAGTRAAKALRSILCAVDLSAPSEKAFLSALDLARSHDAALHVVCVWEPPAYVARDAELAKSIESALARDLAKLVHRHPAADLTVTRHVRRGAPYVEIVALAVELGVDLVVTGSTGKSGIEHLLLGSVAERVVRSSPVPVLTVRPRSPAR